MVNCIGRNIHELPFGIYCQRRTAPMMHFCLELSAGHRRSGAPLLFALGLSLTLSIFWLSSAAGPSPGMVKDVTNTVPFATHDSGVPTLVVSVVASPADFDLGTQTNLTALASGGITPYNYTWGGLPPGCPITNTSSLNCIPSTSGVFHVSVIVTDSSGRMATNSTEVSVSPSSPFLLVLTSIGPYILAGVAGAFGGLAVVLIVLMRRRRRRRAARLFPFTESQYVPPGPESLSDPQSSDLL